ncbi:4'-phosphopantetheinyl transferase superfamily protein [Pedobacter frigidisoli]|uniref:4'-phosphopantetheinyl transferase superfamily protein n=1 Tax=Pedobacter frigidisoli TaxID=2530455 RepID=A0A4R0NMB7_9SPHI|nr:4'-phosphopantetheinyl transferase superfamily protein [Pedobacter frigidisoli]TCD02002.1 4'-phosphopantetheinyl transferase superfamily protein [Pedobacter frigidisoli]
MINQAIEPKLMESPMWVDWKKISSIGGLNSKECHLFKVHVANYYQKIDNQYQYILSEEELIQSQKFLKHNDKKRFIATRHSIRHIVSAFTATVPASIEFNKTANKKPTVQGLAFNISHSHNCILIGISKLPIGLDVEFMNGAFDYAPLIPVCFDESEAETISGSKNKMEMFYRFWTRKEAILKATGEGLIDDLLSINCEDKTIIRNTKRYYLESGSINKEYIFSLATTDSDVRLKFWNYQPD